MPKYEEIAGVLRQRITEGVYPVGSMLPTRTVLAEEFQVSRVTVKKAIEILTVEGLVLSRQGDGTKILNSSFFDREDAKFRLDNFNGLSSDLHADDRKLTSQVIEFTVDFPDQELADRLQVDQATPVYKIVRLRLLDGEPYTLEHTYMPSDLVPGLNQEILEASIYDFLLKKLGLKFAGSYRHITAERPDSYDVEYLHCKKNDPILQIEQLVYLKNGRPIEYSRSRNRHDTRGYSLLDVKTN